MAKGASLGDQAHLFRIATLFGPPCFLILSFFRFFLRTREVIPGWLFGLLLLVNVPLTWGAVLLIHHATSEAAAGFVRALLAAGDLPPARTYPHQEVLIAQGRYAGPSASIWRCGARSHRRKAEDTAPGS